MEGVGVSSGWKRPDGVVGRDAELDRITGFLDDTSPGVRALLLEGDPGIGKTTLWELGVDAARQRGYRILTARPAEAESQLPYAALSDLLEEVLPDELATVPAPQRQALEVALLRSESGPISPTLAVSAGFSSALRALAATQPLLVAVDDVPWLDRTSAGALSFAARRVASAHAIRFLLARRSADPSPLERAFERDKLQRIELGPLGPGAARALLSQRLDSRVPRRARQEIIDAGQGNPLFMLELGRMIADGGPGEFNTAVRLPRIVDELFAARISRLSLALHRLLLAVALAGELTRAELADITHEPEALDEATDAHLINVDGDRVRASHPLLAAASRGSAGKREQREMNLEIARAVADEGRRARHLALAAIGPDADLAQSVAEASKQAMARGRVQEAAELAEHALQLTPPTSSERVDRLLTLAERLVSASEHQRVEELLVARLDELPNGRARARALLMLGYVADTDSHYEHLDPALVEAGEEQDLRASALMTKAYLYAVDRASRLDAAEDWAMAAVRLTRGQPVEMRERALHALAWVRILRARKLGRLRDTVPAIPEGYPNIHRFVDRPLGFRHAFRGEIEQARTILSRMRAIAEERADVTAACILALHLCELELRAGDSGAAARRLGEADWFIEDRSVAHYVARVAPVFPAIQGVADEAVRLSLPVIADIQANGMRWHSLEALRAHAIASLLLHDPTRAVESARVVWEHMAREQIDDPGAFPVAPDLVEALVELGMLDEARQVVDRLRELAEAQNHPWGLASVKRCLALLDFATGAHDDASTLMTEAIADYDRLGLRFDAARSLLAAGRWQRRQKKWRAARTSLEAAAAAFERMGSPGWATESLTELARVGGRRSPASEALTPAEERVAELAAAGMSNKEIAQAAFVTVATVERHLSHTYGKLGVRSRVQLAGRLAEKPARGGSAG